jgi:preprotein translocase subunit SecG
MFILGVSFIGILTKLLIAVDVIICIMLIFVVLLQRPKSEGLGAAFGGDTASNIFGAQTTNVLTNLTRWLAGIFMGLTLGLAVLYSKNDDAKSATRVYIDNAKKKSDEDKARKQAEDAAKAASDLKNAKPAVVSDPATPAVPAATPTATPVVPPVAPEPAKEPAPAPKPTESPAPTEAPKAPEAAPAEAPKAPEPAKPAEPAPAPAAPEPAKPAGN